jgi:DNA-binding transcriptional LysR family regulator
MAELKDEQFISYREGARLRELLNAAGEHAGFQPQVKLESNESQRIRRLVARRMGVAILPRSDAVGPGAEVCVAQLIEPTLQRDITLAWREERRLPPAATEFLNLARATFTESRRGVRTNDLWNDENGRPRTPTPPDAADPDPPTPVPPRP